MTHQPVYLTNSLTRQKQEFSPLVPGHVGMYVCGPTVSGESHLGHARPFVTFDVVYRLFTWLGYKVRYVRNITDAGHFEEEGRAAEDKVTAKAVLERLEPMELTEKYTRLFHDAMQQLNCVRPAIEPRATGHITEQIAMIQQLIQNGYAYEVNGSVYFDVQAYAQHHHYGVLSGRSITDLLETTRQLESQDEKKHKVDFALWKRAPRKHLMQWDSPWGRGFPGWHIECSAMSQKYLGEQFDIHGGGMDLMFPHHECEIAQSAVANGKMLARYWLHNNVITINGKKMGKSYNNVVTLRELFAGTHPLLEQPYPPECIRFFILQTHYRSTLDFSNEALQAAQRGLRRLRIGCAFLQTIPIPTADQLPSQPECEEEIRRHMADMYTHLYDDLNTAKCLASVFGILPYIYQIREGELPAHALSPDCLRQLKVNLQTVLSDILAIVPDQPNEQNAKLEAVMDILLDVRQRARQKRDFALSDNIRNRLEKVNIYLRDAKDGRVYWE